MEAIDDFRETIDRIKIFKQMIDEEIPTEWQDKRDSLQEEIDKIGDLNEEEQKKDSDYKINLKDSLSLIYDQLIICNMVSCWIVVMYCTAFETFLRDFLVEQASKNPQKMKHYLENILKEQGMKKSSLVSVTVNRPELPPEIVDECFTIQCQSFNDVSRRSSGEKIFVKVFEKSIYKEFYPNDYLPKKNKKENAYKDILILFTLRNQLAHRNGLLSQKYLENMRKENLQVRLDKEMMQEYSNGMFPRPQEILSSKAVDPGFEANNKFEELARSLDLYVKYIHQICTKDAADCAAHLLHKEFAT